MLRFIKQRSNTIETAWVVQELEDEVRWGRNSLLGLSGSFLKAFSYPLSLSVKPTRAGDQIRRSYLTRWCSNPSEILFPYNQILCTYCIHLFPTITFWILLWASINQQILSIGRSWKTRPSVYMLFIRREEGKECIKPWLHVPFNTPLDWHNNMVRLKYR